MAKILLQCTVMYFGQSIPTPIILYSHNTQITQIILRITVRVGLLFKSINSRAKKRFCGQDSREDC